jgi:hypothetical protein
MSDHFDTTLKHRLESNEDGAAVGVSEVRRIELITGAGRRRRLSCDEARAEMSILKACSLREHHIFVLSAYRTGVRLSPRTMRGA